MTSEAQKKARKKYNAQRKRLTVDFYPNEADLVEHINSQPNKQGYIKGLIRRDIGDYCAGCKYENIEKYAYPCCYCVGNHDDMFEPKGE